MLLHEVTLLASVIRTSIFYILVSIFYKYPTILIWLYNISCLSKTFHGVVTKSSAQQKIKIKWHNLELVWPSKLLTFYPTCCITRRKPCDHHLASDIEGTLSFWYLKKFWSLLCFSYELDLQNCEHSIHCCVWERFYQMISVKLRIELFNSFNLLRIFGTFSDVLRFIFTCRMCDVC